MKKKLVSLILALALCLSLSIPASASLHELFLDFSDGRESIGVNGSQSGDGWSYDSGTNTLTLNGVKNMDVNMNLLESGSPTVVLAPGSKNALTRLFVEYLYEGTCTLTFKGSGELVIYDTGTDEYHKYQQENGILRGYIHAVSLQDGLAVTGGANPGDSGALSFKADPENDSTYLSNGRPAKYIRIAPAASGFSDVAANSPFKAAIDWAVEQGITKGLTNTTFGPQNTCTVSHILTFLWRADGQPGDSLLDWANSKGIEPGSLSAPCTRAMAVQFMWIAAGCPAPKAKASFSDVPANAAYLNAMSWAVEKGITNGTSQTTFGPGSLCTRGQIVTFLYRAK